MAFNYKHGGIVKNTADLPEVGRARSLDVAQPFDYLFPELSRDSDALLPVDSCETTIEHLKALGSAMADDNAPADDSTIPPVYTYLGQFIDHDITVTIFDKVAGLPDIKDAFCPISAIDASRHISNGRRAIFDLDNVYGDGPTFDDESPMSEAQRLGFFEGPKLRMGMIDTSAGIPGEGIPPVGDLKRDLPRNGNGQLPDEDVRAPLIGDSRNDENTIVAQLHTGFLRFHNALVDALDSGAIEPPELDRPGQQSTKGYYDDGPGGTPGGCGSVPQGDRALFEQASTLARRHYQWIVLHDYLKTIGKVSVVDHILDKGPSRYRPTRRNPFMPFEHSVAAFRFGHSMVRHEYDFNRNFTFDGPDTATFEKLFQFTGKGGMAGLNTLPFNWVIEWDRFVNTSSGASQFARKIDTRLASDLANMSNEVSRPPESEFPMDVQALLKHLAQRNLLRGYLLSVPTGQAMATAMGFDPLTEAEMMQGNDAALNALLRDSGFLNRTPAWYYVLKEAEVRENGNSLGDLGTAIVAETFIGLLMVDPNSILNGAKGWNPAQGAGVSTIAQLLEFAGVMPGAGSTSGTRKGKKAGTPA